FIAIPILVPSSWKWLEVRSEEADNTTGRANQNGVDINRNFPHMWEAQSAGEFGWTWKGASPASEKETQAVMNIFSQHKPFLAFDVHTNESQSETGQYHGWMHSGAVGDLYSTSLTSDARAVYQNSLQYNVTDGY